MCLKTRVAPLHSKFNFYNNNAVSATKIKAPSKNNEKRKEKSRDAARCRRGKESDIFCELSSLLPIRSCDEASLDKASVIRVAIAYLRTRNLAASAFTVDRNVIKEEENVGHLFMKAMDGFLLVLTAEGDIVYTTENISSFLGISQVDVIGQSLLEYTHPCDHDEVRQITSLTKSVDSIHSFVRFKCTLTSKGRNVHLKSASYKVVQMTGHMVKSKEEEEKKTKLGDSWVVAFGKPVPHPSNIEVPLDKQTFVSKHSLDMKFTYVDENVFEFCEYDISDLLGRSLYEMHHALDTRLMQEAYKTLRSKGQVETERYRFLSRGGGYIWVVTQATLINGHKDPKPQYVVCLNYVISEIEHPDIIFSEHQLNSLQSRPHQLRKSSPLPTSPKYTGYCNQSSPVAATCSLLTDRTDDMNEGYLTFINNDPQAAVLKKDPEDLTHLAPSVGDDYDHLEVPNFPPFFDDFLVDCSTKNSSTSTEQTPTRVDLQNVFPPFSSAFSSSEEEEQQRHFLKPQVPTNHNNNKLFNNKVL